MNISDQFAASSEQLRLEFERTRELLHNTAKGDTREGALIKVLGDHLPARYSLARGEVVSPQGKTSRQCDAVIYDAHRCPRLFVSSSYTVFPVESVYGAMEVKSTLSSSELELAHENIASLKRLVAPKSFLRSRGPLMRLQMEAPKPVGVIVGYRAERSINAVADQLRKLNEVLPDPSLAPDMVVILGVGYVGPSRQIRSALNKARSLNADERCKVNHVGKHALLFLYLRLLDELNSIAPGTPNLRRYLNAPFELDGHVITGHEMHKVDESGKGYRCRIASTTLRKVIAHLQTASPMTFRDVIGHQYGGGFESPGATTEVPEEILAETVYEYNPTGAPPMDIVKVLAFMASGGKEGSLAGFRAVPIVIDGKKVFVDVGALNEGGWEKIREESLDEFRALNGDETW